MASEKERGTIAGHGQKGERNSQRNELIGRNNNATITNLKMEKLTKDELEKKRKYHKKRTKFYSKKIEKAEKTEKRIGFIRYD